MINLLKLSFFTFIFPNTLWACAVCGFGQDGTEMGFIVTTVILTFLPLTIFAGIVYFLIKKNKEINNEV